MRSKFKSAPALLSILSLLLIASTASENLPSLLDKSSFQGLDEPYFNSEELNASDLLNQELSEDFSDDTSNLNEEHLNYEDKDVVDNQSCSLTPDVLQQLKLSDDSAWRINQTGLELLGNDPQQLIQCTESGDRVFFELTGLQRFNRTLEVQHELEFVSRAPETNKSENDSRNIAIFTCPYLGSFLRIQSPNFTASDFLIKYCTRSATSGSVFILSNSKVLFDNTTFSYNQAGAIGASSKVKLTLKNCNFTNNGGRVYSGGAIYTSSAVQLEILYSFYIGNSAARHGGAIYFRQNCSVTIVGSTFSGNRARCGGGLRGEINNTLAITQSTFSGNCATRGGGLFGETNNTFAITDSTFLGNVARNGGAASLRKWNNVRVENSTFLKNEAYYGGGLFFLYFNNLTMRSSTFANNLARRSAAVVALARGNNATIVDAKFLDNSASSAAVMLLYYQNKVTITSSLLSGNKGKLYGGTLSANVFSDLNIANSSFIGNGARWGGAIYIASNANVSISNSHFLKNNASQGGAVQVGMDCQTTIHKSRFEQNTADKGGCLYLDSSELEVQSSNFTENKAQKLGGCFLADSSSITISESILSQNEAEEGGGIHASTGTFLNIKETTISSNSANGSAGGLALMYDSRLLCFLCKIKNNTAMRGGGLHIHSHTKQLVVARLQSSIFEGNNASVYGGGMVVETLGLKNVNCTEPLEPCSNVLLLGTNLTNNNAMVSGSAILATTPENVLVDCNTRIRDYPSIFVDPSILTKLQERRMKEIDPKAICPSWQGNSLRHVANGNAIGTFGHHLVLTADSKDGPHVGGNYSSGFVLPDVSSARQFPRIIVHTIDAFGNTPAPVLFEKDALQLVSPSGFLKDDITFSFENMSCVISSVSASAPKGNYTIKIIPKDEDVLEPTTLNISISDCGINEELTKDTNVCQECRSGSYNFNASKKEGCTPCPEHASCDGIFLLIQEGYWQRSPCHNMVKKCIVDQACDYPNRTENITTFAQNYTDCNFTKTSLEEYGKIQCHKGYKGPLCGSCKKSYGLSSKLECSKCGQPILIVLRFIAAIIYLLAGTIITIKGVLPSSSSQQSCEDVETPLLEPSSSTPMDVGISSQVRSDVQNGNQDPQQPLTEGDEDSQNLRSHEDDEIEVTKQKLISLNFFQVTSTAATMDVEWTKKILDMLEGLNILGAATTESISYSFDCVFSSASNDTKAVWRILFSLIVPLIVISLLSFHWAYKSLTRHGGDWVYFLRRFVLTIITVTYATYFELTQLAMHTFSCVVVYASDQPLSNASTRYWTGDTSLECYKNTHIVLVCISLVIVMLVTIGFPTFTSFSLNQHKSEVRDTSTWTHDTLGFLGGPFKERFIYWECVTMIKKAILSIIIVFSYSLEAQAEGLLILLVLVFFLYTHFLCYPYDEQYHTLNYYESGSLLVSCVTYTLIQFFNVERFSEVARSIISLSVIAINAGFICLMAYKIIKDLVRLLRALLKSQNIYIPKNLNVFSLIKVYYKRRRPSQDGT